MMASHRYGTSYYPSFRRTASPSFTSQINSLSFGSSSNGGYNATLASGVTSSIASRYQSAVHEAKAAAAPSIYSYRRGGSAQSDGVGRLAHACGPTLSRRRSDDQIPPSANGRPPPGTSSHAAGGGPYSSEPGFQAAELNGNRKEKGHDARNDVSGGDLTSLTSVSRAARGSESRAPSLLAADCSRSAFSRANNERRKSLALAREWQPHDREHAGREIGYASAGSPRQIGDVTRDYQAIDFGRRAGGQSHENYIAHPYDAARRSNGTFNYGGSGSNCERRHLPERQNSINERTSSRQHQETVRSLYLRQESAPDDHSHSCDWVSRYGKPIRGGSLKTPERFDTGIVSGLSTNLKTDALSRRGSATSCNSGGYQSDLSRSRAHSPARSPSPFGHQTSYDSSKKINEISSVARAIQQFGFYPKPNLPLSWRPSASYQSFEKPSARKVYYVPPNRAACNSDKKSLSSRSTSQKPNFAPADFCNSDSEDSDSDDARKECLISRSTSPSTTYRPEENDNRISSIGRLVRPARRRLRIGKICASVQVDFQDIQQAFEYNAVEPSAGCRSSQTKIASSDLVPSYAYYGKFSTSTAPTAASITANNKLARPVSSHMVADTPAREDADNAGRQTVAAAKRGSPATGSDICLSPSELRRSESVEEEQVAARCGEGCISTYTQEEITAQHNDLRDATTARITCKETTEREKSSCVNANKEACKIVPSTDLYEKEQNGYIKTPKAKQKASSYIAKFHEKGSENDNAQTTPSSSSSEEDAPLRHSQRSLLQKSLSKTDVRRSSSANRLKLDTDSATSDKDDRSQRRRSFRRKRSSKGSTYEDLSRTHRESYGCDNSEERTNLQAANAADDTDCEEELQPDCDAVGQVTQCSVQIADWHPLSKERLGESSSSSVDGVERSATVVFRGIAAEIKTANEPLGTAQAIQRPAFIKVPPSEPTTEMHYKLSKSGSANETRVLPTVQEGLQRSQSVAATIAFSQPAGSLSGSAASGSNTRLAKSPVSCTTNLDGQDPNHCTVRVVSPPKPCGHRTQPMFSYQENSGSRLSHSNDDRCASNFSENGGGGTNYSSGDGSAQKPVIALWKEEDYVPFSKRMPRPYKPIYRRQEVIEAESGTCPALSKAHAGPPASFGGLLEQKALPDCDVSSSDCDVAGVPFSTRSTTRSPPTAGSNAVDRLPAFPSGQPAKQDSMMRDSYSGGHARGREVTPKAASALKHVGLSATAPPCGGKGQFIGTFKDIDSFLQFCDADSFDAMETKFERDSCQNPGAPPSPPASPLRSLTVAAKGVVTSSASQPACFIGGCMSIDELLGPDSDLIGSPQSFNDFVCFFENTTFSPTNGLGSCAGAERHPRFREYDSSAIRVHEAQQGQGVVKKVDDTCLQLYQGSQEGGAYLDLDCSIEQQKDEFSTFDREDASVVLRSKLSVRVHAIIDKLVNSSGRELRHALFALKQVFQDDRDLVQAFVENRGLDVLVRLGQNADHNYQNYVLRALGQVMLYVDGMHGVANHNPTVQWLYSLTQSNYRLVVKAALKLLLVFLDYSHSNCLQFLRAMYRVQKTHAVRPWSSIMKILSQRENSDSELLVYAMSVVNKTLDGLPDQDSYYDIVDSLEDMGMERIVQFYLSRQGVDCDLLQQLQHYETVLRLEDGDASSNTKVPACVRNRKQNPSRRSCRHSGDSEGPPCKVKPSPLLQNLIRSVEEPSIFASSELTPAMRRWVDDHRSRDYLQDENTDPLHVQSPTAPPSTNVRQVRNLFEQTIQEQEAADVVPLRQEPPRRQLIDLSGLHHAQDNIPKVPDHRTQSLPSSVFLKQVDDGQLQHPGYPPLKPPLSLDTSAYLTSPTSPPGSKLDGRQPVSSSSQHSRVRSPYGEWGTSFGLKTAKSVDSPSSLGPLSGSSGRLTVGNDFANNLRKFNDLEKDDAILHDLIWKSGSSTVQWQDFVKSIRRPLFINEYDFTDLNENDDVGVMNDSCYDLMDTAAANAPNVLGAPPPPPPPPPPPTGFGTSRGGTGPPPPPPPPPPPGLCGGLRSAGGPGAMFLPAVHQERQQHHQAPLPWVATKQSDRVNGTMLNKNKKTVKLFWKEIKEDPTLLARINKHHTVWDELDQESIDTARFEELFESRAKDLVKQKQEGKRHEITVLDAKRSNAINIGMTKLPNPRTIRTAILKMDSTIMNREGIEKILTTMLPQPEEMNRIAEAQVANPEVPLGSAEQFLLMLSAISELEPRLRLWAFILDYNGLEKEVAEPLMDLKQAIIEIETNATFRVVLSTVLAIGNFLNGAPIKGFQLDYLAKVPEVKDTVYKHSLLYHVVDLVTARYPSLNDLYSEMAAVTRASKVDFDETAKTLNKLEIDCKASWEHLKAVARHEGSGQQGLSGIATFLSDCAERITVLGVIHKRVLNRFHKLMVYFGYPLYTIKEAKPHETCKVISEFALEYRTTREKIREQIEKKRREADRLSRRRSTTGNSRSNTPEPSNGSLPRRVRGSSVKSERELTRLLAGGYSSDASDNDYRNWGSLGRRSRAGSVTQVSRHNSISSIREGEYMSGTDGDELMETLVRTASQQGSSQRSLERQRKFANSDRRSLRRAIQDPGREERTRYSYISS